MLSFFKLLLRGIIVTVLLPVILAVWVLYGVYCLFIFIIMFIKSIIVFFKGGSLSGETKEDLEARRINLEREKQQAEAAQAMSSMYQAAMAQVQYQQMLNAQQASVQPGLENAFTAPVQPTETTAEEAREEVTEDGSISD